MYEWESQIQEDQEYKLLIKTKKSNWSKVERLILEKHSYSVPEITQIPIDNIHSPYENWLNTIVSNVS